MARVARERRKKKDDKNVAVQQPLDAEARRMRLKNLIVLGKERGYLTYAEINDHLPDDMLDAEQIENIISMWTQTRIPILSSGDSGTRTCSGFLNMSRKLIKNL